MIKIAIAGAVNSTLATLKKLIDHKMNVVSVLGYEPRDGEIISGFADLKPLCLQYDLPFKSFHKINSADNIQYLRDVSPDVLFVVGLSQLISQEMLDIPLLGCVGFHPTALPKGRGRAPIAWLVLEEKIGAANFFLMKKGVDDGPIFVQETFNVEDSDDAAVIENKIIDAIDAALDKWLPNLCKGLWNPVDQDEFQATYYEKRTPDDGWIDWNQSNLKIDRLIKASAHPHPGSYTFLGSNKISINKCRVETDNTIKGVTGRILRVNAENECLIQCGTGLLWLSEITDENKNSFKVNVGQKFGYYVETEIYKLKKELARITALIEKNE